jgi:hypothetical protein
MTDETEEKQPRFVATESEINPGSWYVLDSQQKYAVLRTETGFVTIHARATERDVPVVFGSAQELTEFIAGAMNKRLEEVSTKEEEDDDTSSAAT